MEDRGQKPLKKISWVELWYANLEHSDWPFNIFQPIRVLKKDQGDIKWRLAKVRAMMVPKWVTTHHCFWHIWFFGSGCDHTRPGHSNGIGSGGVGSTRPRHDDEGERAGHLTQRVADVVDGFTLHPKAVHLQDLVACQTA